MNDLQKSCVFLTTPTSATESIWRILYQVTFGILKARAEGDLTPPMHSLSNDQLAEWKPEPEGELYIYRRSYVANQNLCDPDLRLVVNVRDTRDIACNQFHWHLQHPAPGKDEKEVDAHRERVRQKGIDRFVLEWDDKFFVRAHRAIETRLSGSDPNVLLISYSQLCLDFDSLIDDLCRFFHKDKKAVNMDAVNKERVESLADNPSWIGNMWSGSDTAPGRFRRELQPETIGKLNEKHRQTLDFFRQLEKPHLAQLYDD